MDDAAQRVGAAARLVLFDRAAELLGCRPGATGREVRAAYRALLLAARPDTGQADATWLARVQHARDLLLSSAPPDRRRRDRVRGQTAAPAGFLPLRRATWQSGEPRVPAYDVSI